MDSFILPPCWGFLSHTHTSVVSCLVTCCPPPTHTKTQPLLNHLWSPREWCSLLQTSVQTVAPSGSSPPCHSTPIRPQESTQRPLPPGRPPEILPRILQTGECPLPCCISHPARHSTHPHHAPALSCLSVLSTRVQTGWMGSDLLLAPPNPW